MDSKFISENKNKSDLRLYCHKTQKYETVQPNIIQISEVKVKENTKYKLQGLSLEGHKLYNQINSNELNELKDIFPNLIN